jgi:hypothetical protein
MPDVMTNKFAQKYGRSGTCGDSLSEAITKFLRDPDTGRMSTSRFEQILEDNAINRSWYDLNNGQRRMMVGNVLRGMIRRGRVVTVGDHKFAAPSLDKSM